jgi:hypothetical protein
MEDHAMKRTGFLMACRRRRGVIAAIAFTFGMVSAVLASAAPGRQQSLVDLSGGPTLEDGIVVVNDGGPNALQITVNVQGTTPFTHLQAQFEGRKEGVRVHYQICNFTTDAEGDGACHFNNHVGGAAAIAGNAVPLGAGGTITPGLYSPAPSSSSSARFPCRRPMRPISS